MARRKNEISDNKEAFPAKTNLTFDEAVELFLKEQKILNRTPRTIEWHKENFHVLKKAFREQDLPLNLKDRTNELRC